MVLAQLKMYTLPVDMKPAIPRKAHRPRSTRSVKKRWRPSPGRYHTTKYRYQHTEVAGRNGCQSASSPTQRRCSYPVSSQKSDSTLASLYASVLGKTSLEPTATDCVLAYSEEER